MLSGALTETQHAHLRMDVWLLCVCEASSWIHLGYITCTLAQATCDEYVQYCVRWSLSYLICLGS